MDIITDYIKQIEVIAGLFLICIGVVVGVFKQYWFIAGVNTMSKKKVDEVDLEYLGKWFGIFFGIFGLFMVLSPLLFNCFSVTHEGRGKILNIAFPSFIVLLILYFNVIKRKRVYYKNDRDCSKS